MKRRMIVATLLAFVVVIVGALPALAVSKSGADYASYHRNSCNYTGTNPEIFQDRSALFHCPGSASGFGWVGDQTIYFNFPAATGLDRDVTCDCDVTYYGDVRFLDVYWEKNQGRVHVRCFGCDVLIRSVTISKP